MRLHKFVLLFQAYCPVAIETDRKNSRFHLKNGTLWGKKLHLPTRIFVFDGRRTLYWRVFGGKLHMFISLCLLKINRQKNFPYRSSLYWQWGGDLKSSAGLWTGSWESSYVLLPSWLSSAEMCRVAFEGCSSPGDYVLSWEEFPLDRQGGEIYTRNFKACNWELHVGNFCWADVSLLARDTRCILKCFMLFGQ